MLTFLFYVELQVSRAVNSSHRKLIYEEKLCISKLGQGQINNI